MDPDERAQALEEAAHIAADLRKSAEETYQGSEKYALSIVASLDRAYSPLKTAMHMAYIIGHVGVPAALVIGLIWAAYGAAFFRYASSGGMALTLSFAFLPLLLCVLLLLVFRVYTKIKMRMIRRDVNIILQEEVFHFLINKNLDAYGRFMQENAHTSTRGLKDLMNLRVENISCVRRIDLIPLILNMRMTVFRFSLKSWSFIVLITFTAGYAFALWLALFQSGGPSFLRPLVYLNEYAMTGWAFLLAGAAALYFLSLKMASWWSDDIRTLVSLDRYPYPDVRLHYLYLNKVDGDQGPGVLATPDLEPTAGHRLISTEHDFSELISEHYCQILTDYITLKRAAITRRYD